MLTRFLCWGALLLAWACLWPMEVPDDAPVAVALGPLMAVLAPALVSAIGGLVGQKMANNASSKAQTAQISANDRAMEFEREKEAARREEWMRTEADNERRWREEIAREQRNYDRSFEEDRFRDRRLDPYRAAGREAVADLTARNRTSMRDLVGVGRI